MSPPPLPPPFQNMECKLAKKLGSRESRKFKLFRGKDLSAQLSSHPPPTFETRTVINIESWETTRTFPTFKDPGGRGGGRRLRLPPLFPPSPLAAPAKIGSFLPPLYPPPLPQSYPASAAAAEEKGWQRAIPHSLLNSFLSSDAMEGGTQRGRKTRLFSPYISFSPPSPQESTVPTYT